MSTKLLGAALLGAGAILAAGTGAYLANRQVPSATVTLDAGRASTPTAEAAAVNETEGVLTPAAETPTTAPAPAPAVQSRASAASPSRTNVRAGTGRASAGTRPAASPTPRPESVSGPTPAPEPGAPVTPEAAAPEPLERAPRVEAPPPPPEPEFEDLVVPADAVVGLRIEGDVTSETAHVEDRVEAVVTRDVRAGGRVAIPAGSRVEGSVVLAERGGKFKERARIGVRFHTLVLADGTRVAMSSEPVYREGATPANESAAKIGGAAIGGAILGAIVGGGRGAAVGGSIGALGGSAAVMAGGRNAAVLAAGSSVTVRLAAPVTVTVER